jgi:hypothetical protein
MLFLVILLHAAGRMETEQKMFNCFVEMSNLYVSDIKYPEEHLD